MKNILIYRYNSICEPFVIRAFEALGCQVDEVTEEMTNKNLSGKDCIQIMDQHLQAKHYDGVFSINFYPLISEICNIYQIPYLAWTVDCPIVELYSHSIKNKWNRIFLFDYAQYAEFAPKNPDCIFYMPLAADVDFYDEVLRDCGKGMDKSEDRWRSDVSFVGSLYSEKSKYSKAREKLPDYLRGYLDGVAETQRHVYGYNFLRETLTQDMALEYQKYADFYHFPEKADRNDVAYLADSILAYRVAELERIHCLQALAEYVSVNLYTASDTSALAPNIKNCGTVKTLSEMPRIFRLSKINLNFTMKAIRTGLPLRIWDIMGCGGFVLTNYQEEIGEYFEIGKEIETFGSEEELVEKTRYYLEHEEERARIARSGYQKVREYHTWVQRVGEMLNVAWL